MVPREFGLTDERRAFAEANGVDPGGEFAKFQDHEFKTAHVDWDKAWRNWVRRSLELRANGRRSGRTTAEVLREIRAAEEKKSNAG